MSGALDSKFVPLALRLIKRFGADATYTRVTQGVYSSATATATPTRSNTSLQVLIDIGGVAELQRMFGVQSDIQSNDLPCYVAGSALAAEPTEADQVTIGTRIYAVKNFVPIYSGNQVALYALQLRK